MDDIYETIRQYEHSRDMVEQRLRELNAQLARCVASALPSGLVERRMFLYIELAELTGAIREMEEYQLQIKGRKAAPPTAPPKQCRNPRENRAPIGAFPRSRRSEH